MDTNCDGFAGEGDDDADGFPACEDCDDGDSARNPLAVETCDDVDEDCDGYVDDGAVDGTAWYFDLDGDGYGASLEAVVLCDPPDEAVGVGGDCDDDDPQVNPAGQETCGTPDDDDCDGSPNELNVDGCTWFFADGDGDGWGGPSACLCRATAAFPIAIPGDCDDADDAVHPDATDACPDDLDADCDGWLACLGEIDGIAIAGATAGDYAGYAVAGGGDVDGDGTADLLLSAFGYHTWAGGVFVFPGTLSTDQDLTGASATIEGEGASDYFGSSIATGADFDGDGQVDLAVGSSGADDAGSGAGEVLLFPGPLSSLQRAADAPGVVSGARSDEVPDGLAAGEDVNGDGLDDVAIGAIAAGSVSTTSGLVGVLSGSPWPVAGLAQAAFQVEGDTGEELGRSVLLPGDLDGDGLGDLVVGASEGMDSSGAHTGLVAVFLGPLSGATTLAARDAVRTGVDPRQEVGWELASAGDVDDDGLADLLAQDLGQAAVYLWTSPASGSATTDDAWLTLDAGSGFFGESLAAGDLDGDGRQDLVVGDTSATIAGSHSGAVFFFASPTGGHLTADAADLVLHAPSAESYAGASVALPGDVDDDGCAEIFIGAYYTSDTLSHGGVATLVEGCGLW